MNQTKKVPKWVKITLGVIPVLLIVGIFVFGGDIIGGQGMIKKGLVSKKVVPVQNSPFVANNSNIGTNYSAKPLQLKLWSDIQGYDLQATDPSYGVEWALKLDSCNAKSKICKFEGSYKDNADISFELALNSTKTMIGSSGLSTYYIKPILIENGDTVDAVVLEINKKVGNVNSPITFSLMTGKHTGYDLQVYDSNAGIEMALKLLSCSMSEASTPEKICLFEYSDLSNNDSNFTAGMNEVVKLQGSAGKAEYALKLVDWITVGDSNSSSNTHVEITKKIK